MKFFTYFSRLKKIPNENSLVDEIVESTITQEFESCSLEFYEANKSKITIVLDILKTEGYNPFLSRYYIVFSDENLKEQEIFVDNIATHENRIAWLQSSSSDNHLLKVFESGRNFNWIPKTYNSSWNCDCHLLEWFNDHLIFIYKEKHDIYICAINDDNVRYFNYHGEAIERNKEIIYFKEYGKDCDDTIDVRRIKIPELIELDPVSVESLKEMNLVPKSVDFHIGMYLRGK